MIGCDRLDRARRLRIWRDYCSLSVPSLIGSLWNWNSDWISSDSRLFHHPDCFHLVAIISCADFFSLYAQHRHHKIISGCSLSINLKETLLDFLLGDIICCHAATSSGCSCFSHALIHISEQENNISMKAVKTFFILYTFQTLCDQNRNAFSLKHQKMQISLNCFLSSWRVSFLSCIWWKATHLKDKILSKTQGTTDRIWNWTAA